MLEIVEAKRVWFPVVCKDKSGQPIRDKDTGEVRTRMCPGGYKITLSDGQWVSVTSRNGEAKFSLNCPGTPIMDCLRRVIGRGKNKQVWPASNWKQFCAEYNRCGLPALVTKGMEMADEELAAA